jgi:YVTN family beta-propeller protein
VNTKETARSNVRLYRFGPYELDLAQNELRKFGLRLKLPPKPLRLLLALLDHSGEVVTRSELRQLLWSEGVFVDFEKGLTVAVTKLRAALNDSSDNPKYIATVAGQGYRFLEHVQPVFAPQPIVLGGSCAEASRQVEESNSTPTFRSLRAPDARSVWTGTIVHIRRRLVLAATLSVLVVVVAIGLMGSHSRTLEAANPRGSAAQKSAGAAHLFLLNQNGYNVSVLNTLRDSLELTIPMEADPRGAAILPDGATLYISVNRLNRVVALDTHSSHVVSRIPVGNNPVGVAANPRPPFVYVANNYSNSVSVIDSRSNTVVQTLAVGGLPTEIAVSADGTRTIVTNQSGGSVTMIDSVANVVLATIPVGSTPVGVAFTPDSKFAWITLAGEGEAVVIDVARQQVVHRVRVGLGPVRVVFTRDGRHAIVSNFYSNTLTVVDTASLQSTHDIEVGLNPVGLALNPAGDRAFVANYGSNTLSVIDTSTMKVIRTLKAGTNPVEIAVLACYAIACDGR